MNSHSQNPKNPDLPQRNQPGPPHPSFDPFRSRRARDVRNRLSESLVRTLDERNPELFREAAREVREPDSTPAEMDYVRERLRSYERALQKIRERGLDDPLQQAAVLWDEGLYFEFHERLEGPMRQAAEAERAAYKGLIKAAAAYVHLQYGHDRAARRLAAKAAKALSARHELLQGRVKVDALLEALERQDGPRTRPPPLMGDE
jgi:hypothetical protein